MNRTIAKILASWIPSERYRKAVRRTLCEIPSAGFRYLGAGARQIFQLFIGKPPALFHILLLHLRHDAPAAAEGETAEFQKSRKDGQCPFELAVLHRFTW